MQSETISEQYENLSPRDKRKFEEKKKRLEASEIHRQKIKEIFDEITFREMYDYCIKRIIGQSKGLRKAVYIIYSYMNSYVNCKPLHQKNWFLTAPSGMGKTELYRTIRDFFKLKGIDFPVVKIDLSQITETGFKGADINSVIPIIEESCSYRLGGYGICFFDEADKKMMPSYGSNGDNINAKVQSNLLAFIEDTVINEFDTSNTMFVFMGAFQNVRNRKSSPKKRSMGFNSNLSLDDDAPEDTAFYDDITIQDMLDCGMIDEFAGRVSQVINFHRIDKKDMEILIESKIENLEIEFEISIYIEPKAFEQLIDLAYGKFGIREPINKLNEIIIELKADAMLHGGIDPEDDYICINSLDCYDIEHYTCCF